jgi:hypothetical protein
LREFLKSGGSDPENCVKKERRKVETVLKAMANKSDIMQTTVGEEQGIEYILRNRKLMQHKNLETMS